MRKLIALILSALLLSGLAACGPATAVSTAATSVSTLKNSEQEQELVVFAAASLNKALSELAVLYEAQHPGIKLTFTFDSSGTLKTQIQEGADCDVFISAGQKQMNQLDSSAKPELNTEGLDFVLAGSRFDLLENQIVLAVPAANPLDIQSFSDLHAEQLNLMVICNSDTPVGQYAAELLNHLGLYEALNKAGKITFASNATEATTQIAEAAVDCGIIYRTDVVSAVDPDKLSIIAVAPPGSVSPAIYPAAIMKNSAHTAAATAFLAYLRSNEAQALLQRYGFVTQLD